MKLASFFLSLIISITLFGQSNSDAEINEQVWIPFTKSWESNDAEMYNSIHTKDVWRINASRLLIGDEYKNRNTERMQGQKNNSIIEFSFETRRANGTSAYEVGYFRITRTTDGQQFVGRFHVALKKVEGKWKIAQDWDTDIINGVTLTPESLNNRKFTHFE